MNDFSQFFEDSTTIKRIAEAIAGSKNPQHLEKFVNRLNNKDASKMFEAWYNPMDWVRGAGRFAATRFAAEPQVQHIEELFHSLSKVIHQAGKGKEFQSLLSAMGKQIEDLKLEPSTRNVERNPADPTQDPAASGHEAKTSSKDPTDKTDVVAQQHMNPDDIDNAIQNATSSQSVGSSDMSPEEFEQLVKSRQKPKPAYGTPFARHQQTTQGGTRQWGPQYGYAGKKW